MDFLFDTASDWLAVNGFECTNCSGSTYDIRVNQINGTATLINDDIFERTYGDIILQGKTYKDSICFLGSACVEDFEFFYITAQEGLNEHVDGILGAARDHSSYLEPQLGNQTGPLFLDAIYNQGLISELTFSLHLNTESERSSLDYGAPDLSGVRRGDFPQPISMIEEDFFWAQYCQGVAIGDSWRDTYRWGRIEDYPKQIGNGSIYSIFDTGTPFLMISALYYDSLISKIFLTMPSRVIWRFDDDLRVLTECEADYPSISFMFDQKWIEVRAQDYVFQEQDDDFCYFLIAPVDLPFNILGVPIFNGYYSIFEQKPVPQISFAPLQDSNKRSILAGS